MISSEGQKILNRDYAHLIQKPPPAEIPSYPQEKKEKEEIVIETVEDIITHKPSVKKVRDYFSGVIENINSAEDGF